MTLIAGLFRRKLYGHLRIDDDILSGNIESSVELEAIIKHPKWEGDGQLLVQLSPEEKLW